MSPSGATIVFTVVPMSDRIPPESGAPSSPLDTDSAVQKLRKALTNAGLVLPSLDADPVFIGSGRLVQLGRVNAATADKLAAVISRGTEL